MLFLSIRYLLARKKQTLLILLGILLGTSAYVGISGMMLGFQTYLLEQLVNNDAHVRISPREEFITEESLSGAFFLPKDQIFWQSPPSGRRDRDHIIYPQGWYEILAADPRVEAYSPQMTTQVILKKGTINLGVRLMGSNAQSQMKVSNIESYMVSGHFADLGETGNRLIVGESLLKKIGARLDDHILLTAGTSEAVPFQIKGIFNTGMKNVDEGTVYGALSDVQRVNGTPSQINGIAVRLNDYHLADAAAKDWQARWDDRVESWGQINSGVLSIFKTQDIVRYMMTVSILVVAGFGIYNVLNMMVMQKRKDIAILRSVGFESRDVLWLFAMQGIVLGIAGGLLGLLVGYGVSYYLSTIEVDPGRLSMGGKMMISFESKIYIRGFFLAFAASTFASILPARSAGKLSPIEIIRTEGS